MYSLAMDFAWGRASASQTVDGTLQILQQTLDDTTVQSAQRREVLRLLLRSSGNFSLLPSSYYIRDVVCDRSEPRRMGGFADVYRAVWKGQAVAVKVVRMFSSSSLDISDPIQAAFRREIIVSRQVEHPYIQPFWGLHQIALGLQHLHCLGIVHGDLRGANILIDEFLHPRLADFGLSILADAYTRTLGSHSGGVAVRWSSPELLGGVILRPNFASDIYAFGCTCIELYSRQKPFNHIPTDVQVVYQLALGAKPGRPETGKAMPEALWTLVEQCLRPDPSKRPALTEIVNQLEAMQVNDA
ncbi:hypothetical protein EIP91_001020 [Steccherinum ochraceum]|uniref:Protein kinase domain-containing protein n=1 Tax=Steccherinum ochraceum TaxID=92696 RepID=A0A4V2MWL9_9APHY|nr:hypothetical protein EIP91_001020 [Steccherinum ochraceum]